MHSCARPEWVKQLPQVHHYHHESLSLSNGRLVPNAPKPLLFSTHPQNLSNINFNIILPFTKIFHKFLQSKCISFAPTYYSSSLIYPWFSCSLHIGCFTSWPRGSCSVQSYYIPRHVENYNKLEHCNIKNKSFCFPQTLETVL